VPVPWLAHILCALPFSLWFFLLVPVPDPDSLAERLRTAAGNKDRFGATAADVLETAALIAAAAQEWEPSAVAFFQEEQKIHKKVWDKLLAIHRDSRLKALQDFLPASYTALYALVVMKDEELNAAVADGLLKTKVLSSRAILEWTKAYRLKSTGIEREIPLTLILKEQLTEEQRQDLFCALQDVAVQYGSELHQGKWGLKQSEVKAEARAALALRIEEDLMREIGPVVLNAPEDFKRQFAVSSASDLIGGTRANFTGFFQNLVGKKDELFWRNYGHSYCLKIARDFNLTESRAERFQFKKRIDDAIKKWGGTINGFTEMAEGVLKTYMR